MNTKKLIGTLALIGVISGTAACKREATGQVAAVVNGEEITLQELNTEIGGAELPAGVDRKAMQQAALQRVIERRLLSQASKDDGLDKGQEYLVRSRQLSDTLLVQLLSRKASQAVKVPGEADVDKFMASNPTMFGNRTIYALDRIQFPMPSDPNTLRALQPIHTMQGVVETLNGLNIKFARSAAQMDSAQVPKEAMERIAALPAGEPFVVPQNGVITVSVITGSRAVPIDGNQARPMAVQAMRNQEVMKSLSDRLKTEKAEAKIDYQPGFAPPKPGASPAAGAPATAPK